MMSKFLLLDDWWVSSLLQFHLASLHDFCCYFYWWTMAFCPPPERELSYFCFIIWSRNSATNCTAYFLAADPMLQAYLLKGKHGSLPSCLPIRDGVLFHLYMPTRNWLNPFSQHLFIKFNWNLVVVFLVNFFPMWFSKQWEKGSLRQTIIRKYYSYS